MACHQTGPSWPDLCISIDEGNNTGSLVVSIAIDSYPPCTNSVLLVIFKLNAYFYNVALVICDISFAVF